MKRRQVVTVEDGPPPTRWVPAKGAALKHSPEALRSVLGLVLGAKLGKGAFREVYAYAPDPANYVVKLQHRVGNGMEFSNVAEWLLWQGANPALRKWLAPCHSISEDGLVLIQRRGGEVSEEEIPKKVPLALTDTHAGNWGRVDGKVVMVDYGLNNGGGMVRMSKAKRDPHRG